MFNMVETFILIKFQLICFPPQPEAYLDPSRTSRTEPFRKNSGF